jgi:hypothetical protein
MVTALRLGELNEVHDLPHRLEMVSGPQRTVGPTTSTSSLAFAIIA